MSLQDTPAAYGIVSRLNHWVGAALIILMLGIGLYFHEMPRGEELRYWMGLHVSIGALAFLPLAFRVSWRLWATSPQPLPQKPWLQRTSQVTHALLLGLIAVMIVSGPLTVWSGGRPIEVFGWFAVPSPMGRQEGLHEALEVVHGVGSRLLLLTITLHVLAAAWHALIERNRAAMARMLGAPVR